MEWMSIQGDQWMLCPLDGSFLVSLGSFGAMPDLPGVREYYCPRCDVAFLLITSRDEPDVTGRYHESVIEAMTWRRRGDEFEPEQGYPPGFFTERQWEVRTKNLRYHARCFRRQASALVLTHPPCLQDASPGSRATILNDRKGNTYTLGWCVHCENASSYVRDEHYGWEGAAIYDWIGSQNTFRLREVLRYRGSWVVDGRSLFTSADQIPPPSTWAATVIAPPD